MRVTVAAVAVGVLSFVGCLQLGEWVQREPAAEPVVEAPPDRLVRVRLGGREPRRSATVEVTAACRVEDGASGRVLAEKAGRLGPVVVRAASGRGVLLGEEYYDSGDVFLTPARDAAVVVDGHTYRGRLRVVRSGDGFFLDNHVDVESYLRGVLRGELPRFFHPESFKAQAVAARTYVLYQKLHGPAGRAFDVFDHEGSQMYIGVRGEDAVAVEAVSGTTGEVCVWRDAAGERMFCTYYSSTCGGCTQHVNNLKPNDPAVPPLAGGVACNDCNLAKFYRWDPVEITAAELTKRLVARYPSLSRLGTVVGLEPKARTPDGRIVRLQLVGASGAKETLLGEDFRLCVGGRVLKSTNFDIGVEGDRFIFRNGKGFGHGVGLCQYGMDSKARRGQSYRQILATYYPGSEIKKLY